MRAITVKPGEAGSARLEDREEPEAGAGSILVETLAVGVCGTDHEILAGAWGAPPPGRSRLVLGHESLGRVLAAPATLRQARDERTIEKGDLVVGIVRRPDPLPCRACAAGEWDLCENGRFTEHGIKELDGFAAERFRLPLSHAVRLEPHLESTGVLLEPASVVAKAWAHVDHVARRSTLAPRRALVTGAGPIGLLAALLARQRGLEVDVLDRATEGPKPRLVAALGATYHTDLEPRLLRAADVIVEATGAARIVLDAMMCIHPNGILCLTGIAAGHREETIDANRLNRLIVLENNVVLGSVNANRQHYAAAADALARADRSWLEALVTRRVPLDEWEAAYRPEPGDVKTVIEFRPTRSRS